MSPAAKRALLHEQALNALFKAKPSEVIDISLKCCKTAEAALEKFKLNRELKEPGLVAITKDELEAIQIKLKLPPDMVPSKLYGQPYILLS